MVIALRKLEYSEIGYPMVHSQVFHTSSGTPYLKQPGVTMISAPRTDLSGMRSFLEDFGHDLDFSQYLEDPVKLPDGSQLIKAAGQTCYAAFGAGVRSMNTDAERYLDNIKSSGHGSVLEHANYTFLSYGASRSKSHEEVRHRAGFAYSQLSQRYVDGKVLRFVERREFASDPQLHEDFEARIDRAARDYESTAKKLIDSKANDPVFQAMAPRDRRKTVNQAARDLLPNETETFLFMTGNVRAWRHYVEMRASEHADTAIRACAVEIFRCLVDIEPMLFGDHELYQLPDGSYGVQGGYSKV